jgi:hypothetical protein
LEIAITKVRAWELLHDPDYSGKLTMGEFHDLMIAAGYSEATASKQAVKRGWQRLDAGVKM